MSHQMKSESTQAFSLTTSASR